MYSTDLLIVQREHILERLRCELQSFQREKQLKSSAAHRPDQFADEHKLDTKTYERFEGRETSALELKDPERNDERCCVDQEDKGQSLTVRHVGQNRLDELFKLFRKVELAEQTSFSSEMAYE